jgi:hypothetical protein
VRVIDETLVLCREEHKELIPISVILINRSKKKRFKNSRRLAGALLYPLTKRVHIGNLPKRVLRQLIISLKEKAGRGTSVQVFYANKDGFMGYKCIEIGGSHFSSYNFNQALG